MTCTGIAASWCPVHGDCTCPRDEYGEIESHYEGGLVRIHGSRLIGWSETAIHVTHWAMACPLHGQSSEHAEDGR